MSDPADTGQRNPLSSSSSHASGTSARSVTIPAEQTAPAAGQAAPNTPPTSDDTAPISDDTSPISEASFQSDGASPEHHAEIADQPSNDGTDGRSADAEPEVAQYAAAPQPDVTPEVGYAAPIEPIQEAVFGGEATQPASGLEGAVEHPAATAAEDTVSTFAHDELTSDAPVAAFREDEPAAISDEPERRAHSAGPTLSVVPAVPLPVSALSEDTSELRALARQTIAENEARQQTALAAVEQLSRRFTLALEEAGIDAARVSFKVMEFAQASMKNNLELAKAYAAARSVPDIFGLHAAYLTRQFELLNAQAEELREIAAKMTLRSTAAMKPHLEPVGTSPEQ